MREQVERWEAEETSKASTCLAGRKDKKKTQADQNNGGKLGEEAKSGNAKPRPKQ